MSECEIGGGVWRGQFLTGYPTPGDLAEPGWFPTCVDAKEPMAGGELSRDSQSRAQSCRKKPGGEPWKLCKEARIRVA